ncbi:G2/M phase-specific E3 ubiquitin-protein ligase [Lates japonicus]|uniref:G2/M phase-specific E3 ubiquitin-protein ligase n=1 Tax=Lates japonicus TaxID=270547 RepID=A0AAD3NIS4_LATJO|nr:G2/M phase-specific E3 ubiquitin-protein ligase [Lates japonicus]
MKKRVRRSRVSDAVNIQEECCVLCRFSDDDPAMFGEKVTLKEHKLSVHYFCLLTSCGVYQRGKEDEGVFGFLVDDIKQEIRRSARLRQAHSAGLFFFRCTLCNNKESFQEEMLRMGIYIPERDASWELEANAYSELLEVYKRCDALTCLCSDGPTHSAKTGWFEVIRCRLCGSRGTHRKCSGLKLDTRDWACSDCTQATDGKASLVASPQGGQRRSLLSKRHPSPIHSSISCKRPSLPVRSGSPEELLQALAPQLRPISVQVEVNKYQALSAGLDLVRRPDFDPTHTLSVRFKDKKQTPFPSSLRDSDAARQYFWKLLVQADQDSVVFGEVQKDPESLDSQVQCCVVHQALRDDLYFDVGCLLALSLVHGGPPVGFFSRALYQCLFNYPPNRPLTVAHMTRDTLPARVAG